MTAVLLGAEAWLGIHYMPTPTVVMRGINATGSSGGAAAQIGATAWTVYDGAGVAVGSGTMGSTATAITVVSGGAFIGGSTAHPGFYTVATNTGSNGVCAGYFVICPASSNLWVPTEAPSGVSTTIVGGISQLAAWLGTGPDRDNYLYVGFTAAQITGNFATDEYFVGPQDSARPRKKWVASGAQAAQPTQNPTSTQWGSLAAAMVAAGYGGAYYECPTNEPENGSWTTSQIVTYWNACATAILAADPTAHIMGWASAGIDPGAPTPLATFLAGATSPVSAFTTHIENSHQNLSNITALRQYFGGLKTQFTASGVPHLDVWLTETGINGGGYGVLQPRRDARQRTVLRFVAESYGWAKENCYDFPIADHFGSGLTTYLVDGNGGSGVATPSYNGTLRAGAYALHVMAEALYGTSCSPTNVPASLSFGQSGSLGDSLFAGTHYTSSNGDRVILATNGLESATVTLAVSVTGSITYWDGWGNPSTAVVNNGRLAIPVNDLLTYVFLPANTTVSVVDTDQGIIAMNGYTELTAQSGVSLLNESSVSIAGVVNNGSFAENNTAITGVSAPYKDTTASATLAASNWAGSGGSRPILAYAAVGAGNPWQTAGYGLLSLVFEVGATTVDSWTCESAVSYAIPSASFTNDSDPCTRITWWTGVFARVAAFAPVPGSSATLTVVGSYGGQPDAAASTLAENDAQAVQLVEFAVYQMTIPAASPWLLHRLGTG